MGLQGFSLRQLKHLVLDEADRLLHMDFEQEIDQILKVIPKVGCSARSEPGPGSMQHLWDTAHELLQLAPRGASVVAVLSPPPGPETWRALGVSYLTAGLQACLVPCVHAGSQRP